MMQIEKAASILVMWICVAIKVSCIDTLQQGENLSWSSQLDSPNGLFTLRFYTPSGDETNSTYIAMLYNGDDETAGLQKAVWIGNRDEPLPTNSTPQLTLDARGELTITRPGDPIHIFAGQSQPSNTSNINITATLLDTGNFVVRSNGGELLWQSYDHPTDTLLPGMKLGGATKITSWLWPSDPASGAFTLEWEGELVIRRRGVAYWRSGHLNGDNFQNINISDPYFINYNFTNEGDYFVYNVISVSMDTRKATSGWKLDLDGSIRTSYSINTGTSSTTDIASASNCYGYERIYDPRCQSWNKPECRNRHLTFEARSGSFLHANGTFAPTIRDNSSSLSLSDCRDACWNNCECVAYTDTSDQTYGCNYWIGKDLKWEQDKVNSGQVQYVLISPPKGKNKLEAIIIGLASAVVLLSLGVAYLILRNRRVRREKELHQLLTLEGYTGSYELEDRGPNSHHLKLFTYNSIMSATRHFSPNNKLGEGGFGPVYKGRTAEGNYIAVKLLSRQSGQGLVEFKNELILISELQHVNLVKLIGFCIHKDDKMIIYDYMPNKSLDCFLFSPSERGQLDWQKRFNIIEGTAQGLLYLHKHSRLRIIHRDMKPNNILLDHNMTPKISDFGLARIFKEDAGEVNTNRRVGTYGYMAPEYAMQGIFSVKSDVYSLGVVVLEIVSGRRNSSFHDIEGPLSIVEYAWELWKKDRALELMDPLLRESCVIEQLQKCIQIGLLCVENNAVDRPTTEDVVFMLKNEAVTLPMPTNPGFITRNSVLEQVGKTTQEQSSSNEVIKLSANQVTLSEIQGR